MVAGALFERFNSLLEMLDRDAVLRAAYKALVSISLLEMQGGRGGGGRPGNRTFQFSIGDALRPTADLCSVSP